ncbi:MAG TPA: LuxR C-terminal-related transcriptional regulator [Solirubrobacteraceae bacterium]|jgi:predicted ATPase/class 3 adenylate cyclase/DNA-binding CsgD family transcriptional regulator
MTAIGPPLMWGEPSAAGAGSRFALPAGTVTFLLSDVEGSTRMWSQIPDRMGGAVAEMYSVLDRTITGHDGVRPVEQGEGDSVVGAFSRAADAVAAALAAQRELHTPRADGIELRVRIALHTADAQLRDEGNYFGVALSRCARLRAIARGGQTLLSRATRDLVVDRLPESADLVDCGVHRLRDLGRPEHVFALVHPDLDDDDGTLRSLDAFPNNLPDQLTSFVGRGRELDELRGALADTRLLTLTGAGGAGKTRLALQIAADALEHFPDGAWWVDLAPLTDPQLVSDVLAGALGVRPLPLVTALQASCAHLSGSRALVVLDNCEHVLAASAETAEALLHACPDVTVIATSRTPLGIAGETDWRVPSLSLPAPDRQPEALDILGQSDAVRLFIERARKARPNFAITDRNAPAVAQICHELDGLPLAIELAAARVRMLAAEQIAAGLGDRFRLLTGGTRTALPRQQTLRASVDWSHELLDARERTLLRRLSVFAGGFTLDLAEAVGSHDAIEPMAVLDLLASLVDKSLVVAEERSGTVRYRLLETVRQYGLERLIEAGEAACARDSHRDALLDLAERVAPQLHGPGQQQWLQVLDAEAANLAAALEHAVESDAERALRICVALTFWWKLRGYFLPAERGFAVALDAADPQPSSLRAKALWGRGYLAAWAVNIETGLSALDGAREMAELVGDQSTLARVLTMLGWIELFSDPDSCRVTSERGRQLGEVSGDDWAMLSSDMNLVYRHLFRLEIDQAERLLAEMLPLSEQRGYLELRAWHWLGRCFRPWMAGDREQLTKFTARALEFSRAAGEPSTEALANCFIASLELASGDPRAAVARLEPTRARAITAGAGLALAYTEYFLAPARAAVGEVAQARATLEPLVASGMDGGYLLASGLTNLADVLRIAGDPAGAEQRANEALALAERIGTPMVAATARETLGRLAAARADWERAESVLQEALALRVQYDMRIYLPGTFDALAEVAAGVESFDEAARILGAAQRARSELGLERWGPDAPGFARLQDTLREALGDQGFAAAHREGEALSATEAVTWMRHARGERKRPARGWESLTPTERRVVALVAQGLTNPQIGERMFITRGTVKVHLSHIFAKLGTGTRAELAAEATRRSAGV